MEKWNLEGIEIPDKPLYSNKGLKKIKAEGHSKGLNIMKFDNEGNWISNFEFDKKYWKSMESIGEITEGTGWVTREQVN